MILHKEPLLNMHYVDLARGGRVQVDRIYLYDALEGKLMFNFRWFCVAVLPPYNGNSPRTALTIDAPLPVVKRKLDLKFSTPFAMVFKEGSFMGKGYDLYIPHHLLTYTASSHLEDQDLRTVQVTDYLFTFPENRVGVTIYATQDDSSEVRRRKVLDAAIKAEFPTLGWQDADKILALSTRIYELAAGSE